MKFYSLFLILLLSFPELLFSQAAINGFFEYDNITYFKKLKSKINGRNQAILQLELNHDVSSFASVFGSVEIRNDQSDASRNRVYLDEAYLNLYLGDFDIRLGKQIFAWGKADAFNPTDNLTSWDYSDVLDTDDERIGTISGKVIYYFDNWTIEGVLVPSFSKSILPRQNSRWYPAFPGKIDNSYYPLIGNQFLNADYTFSQPILPDASFNNTQYALKLSGTIESWDFSFSWFDGFDDLPFIAKEITIDTLDTEANINITQNYYRRKAIGFDFSTVIDQVGFRGEAAYYLTSNRDGNDPNIDVPYLQYVLGTDYTFTDLIADNNLFLILQWIQEFQIPDNNISYSLTDLNHVFRKSLMGKAELDLGNYAKFTLKGVINIDSKDWWLQPGIDWSVTDGINLVALVDVLNGEDDTFFWLFKDNDRVQVKVKYSF